MGANMWAEDSIKVATSIFPYQVKHYDEPRSSVSYANRSCRKAAIFMPLTAKSYRFRVCTQKQAICTHLSGYRVIVSKTA